MPRTFPGPWGPGRTLVGDTLELHWGRNIQSGLSASATCPEHLLLKRVCSVHHLSHSPQDECETAGTEAPHRLDSSFLGGGQAVCIFSHHPGDLEAPSCLRKAVLKHKAFFWNQQGTVCERLCARHSASCHTVDLILTPTLEEGGVLTLFSTVRKGEAGFKP